MKEFWNNFVQAQDGADATWQILAMLLGAFIFGYLIRLFVSQGRYAKLEAKNQEINSSAERLRKELDAQKKLSSNTDAVDGLKSEVEALKPNQQSVESRIGELPEACNRSRIGEK